MKVLCTLSIQLERAVWDDLEICVNRDGLEYRKVYYTIVMEASSGNLVWRVLYK